MESHPYRRRRPALSCIECRRRKIKCDRNDPCAHCVTTKIKCLYKSHGPDFATVRLFQSNNIPLLGIGTLGGEPIRSPKVSQASTTEPTFEDQGEVSEEAGRREGPNDRDYQGATTAPDVRARTDLRDLLHRVEKLEKSAPRDHNHGLSGVNQSTLALQPELQDAQISLHKERVLKWSNWSGVAQEFETIIDCFAKYSSHELPVEDNETAALTDSIRDLLAKCKMLAKIIKTERPSRRLWHPEVRLAPPSREIADTMVGLYFRTFESVYRILHVPTFQVEYERYWTSPESASMNLTLKILLVIGIGSSLRDFDGADADLSSMCQEWIYAAQAWLSGPLEKDRLDINGLQIHCLTILARQIVPVGGDLVWISTGSLIHRAMQMGLHRDPKYLPSMSVTRAEVRRRLWATILEMTVQSSLNSGMPPRISYDEFDTQPPANVNDSDLDDSSSPLQSHPRTRYTMTSIQLLLLDSLPARLRAVQLSNGLSLKLSYHDVLATSSSILEACRACGNFVRENVESSMTPFHRNLLDYMLRRFLLPLHYPFASQARTNPLFSHSLRVSVDAALAIMSSEADESYWNLRATSGGLFKAGFRGLMTAVSLGLLAQVESQRVDGTLHRHSPHREFLKHAMRDLTALSLERVRRGETNVKSHMFLKMILAQVEATEANVPCELKIAQSANESLTICHDLLRARVDNTPLPEADNIDYADFGADTQGYGLDLDLDFFMPDSGVSWS